MTDQPTDTTPSDGTPLEPISQEHHHSPRRRALEWLITIVVSIAAVVAIQAWLVKPYVVPSGSMENTVKTGDRVFVNRLVFHLRPIHRGDIIVFRGPTSLNHIVLLKRVIGLPGDILSLQDNRIYVNGRPIDEPYIRRFSGAPEPTDPGPGPEAWSLQQPYKVPPGTYFMMGDNRTDSEDSRFWGPIARDAIIGRVFFIYWPLWKIHTL
jgi:signal peptidase I